MGIGVNQNQDLGQYVLNFTTYKTESTISGL